MSMKPTKMTDEERAEKARARAKAWYAENKEKAKAYQREYKAQQMAIDPEAWQKRENGYSKAWRDRNPEKRRIVWMKHKYRMTEEQVQRILDERGMCECCGVAPATDIDHDHETMEFRGQLCHPCNVAAGFVHNDPVKAIAVALYLTKTAAAAAAKS